MDCAAILARPRPMRNEVGYSSVFGMKRFFFWRKGRVADAGQTAPRGADALTADRPKSGLLTGDPREDARSLEVLLDTIAAVSANIDLDAVLGDIVDRSLVVTRAERAILFLGSAPEGVVVRMARDREGRDLVGPITYSRSVLRRCMEQGAAVRSVVQSDEEALELGQSVYDLKLRAVMCTPMVVRDRTIGAIYVDSRALRREFTPRDLALFEAISAQLAVSLENARLHRDSMEKMRLQKDVEVARRIQGHLLPKVPQAIPGLDLALHFSAADQASGDAYDIVPMSNHRVALMVGDVTGHGLGASLLSHASQAAMRSYLELDVAPQEVVTRLNQRLVESVEAGNFLSLLLVVLDPVSRTLRYVNAGHPGLVLSRESGATVMEKTGMVLGVMGGQVYEASPPVQLQPGDVLLLRSDGIDECMSPSREVFGDDRLLAVLQENRSRSAREILDAVRRAVEAHAGGAGPQDDVTMIAVKLVGP